MVEKSNATAMTANSLSESLGPQNKNDFPSVYLASSLRSSRLRRKEVTWLS